MRSPAAIVLLTDFGTRDAYVGVMKGVILGVCPSLVLVDLTHEVPPQDVSRGADLLAEAWRWFPEGTVFLGVVDPGVGSARGAISARVAGRLYVGPDNGLCSRIDADNTDSRLLPASWGLRERSSTFHGRDLFAPAAARLAAGLVSHDEAAPAPFVRLPVREPGSVRHVDHFGNAITDLLGRDSGFVLWKGERVPVVRTYAEGAVAAGGGAAVLVALTGSTGLIEIAVPGGSAWIRKGVNVGDAVSWVPA